MMLAGKVAVVTAAASGIGRASALAMAREGAVLALGDINREGVEAVAREIESTGGRALALGLDARNQADNLALVKAAVDRFGGLHIAHLNAGGGRDTSILNPNLEHFDASIALNIRGCFLGLTAVAPAIVESGGGSIVVTSSKMGLLGQRSIAAYNAGKHAMIGLVKSAAAELAPYGIRVNAVCPAATYTGILTTALPTIEEADTLLGRHNVFGRIARAEEVGEVVLFLASERASFITAAALPIDGGDTALQNPALVDDIEALGARIQAFAK